MNYIKFISVLYVFFVNCDAGGHEGSHDHVKLHVPEFRHHDHHTKVITIHHHHHAPKKEHHHHHHKPIIPYGPPKFYHTHHHSKSASHTVSKGETSVGKKIHGNHGYHGKHHGNHGKHAHSGHSHSGHDSYKHHDIPSYDPPSVNYDLPTVNYAPPSINNYSPSPSYGSDYNSFSPSVPNIPSPHIHGVVHTVQQVKVFDSLPGAIKTGSTGYQVTEQGDEGEEDVFTSVNSLSQAYPGSFGQVKNAAEQSDLFPDIAHSTSNQSPNIDPFYNAQPQPSYANLEEFTSEGAQSVPNIQQYSEVTGYGENSVVGNNLRGASVLSFAEEDQDDTPVTFSREAGLQRAVNSGGIETVAY